MYLRYMLLFCTLLTVAVPDAVRAAVTEYPNDFALWQAAVGNNYTTIGFADLPNNTLVTNQYEDLGALFTDGVDLTLYDDITYPNDGVGLNGAFDEITVEFTYPVYSVAVHHPGGIKFTLYSGGNLLYDGAGYATGGTGNFHGLVSDIAFDEVKIEDPSGGVFIDDLYFGPPVPTPGVLPLLVLAALGTATARKRPV